MKNIIKVISLMALFLPLSGVYAQTGLEQLSEVSAVKPPTQFKVDDGALSEAMKGSTIDSGSTNDAAVNHCGDDRRCWYLSNMFLGEGKVLTLDSNNTLKMAPADYQNPRQMWEIVKQSNGYYRLHNASSGNAKCVDSDQNRPDLRNCGNYSGQYWLLTPQGDWLRISNAYQKKDRVLDTYNAPGNRVFFESKAKNTSGTYWKIRSLYWSSNIGRLVE